jgi:hypothetical protein
MRTHLLIPDTQLKEGVPVDHLYWLGMLIVDLKPDVIINIGDWYDFPSLSLWDKNKKSFEGRRYRKDIQAGHMGLDIVEGPMNQYNAVRKAQKKGQYLPEKHYMLGNHEYRADRVAEDTPELDGTVGTEEIKTHWEDRDWSVHDFRVVKDIDGVWYTHFVSNPMTGNPWGGTIDNRLKQVGNSFSMGHQQAFLYGQRQVGARTQHGLVAGSFYLHDENYKGPSCTESVMSGNHHWRGVVLKHEVSDGNYAIEAIPMDRLCRRYEGVGIQEYLQTEHPERELILAT